MQSYEKVVRLYAREPINSAKEGLYCVVGTKKCPKARGLGALWGCVVVRLYGFVVIWL